MSFETYFWNHRILTYLKKVLPKKETRKRKFVNRCLKVNWDKMEEVQNLGWYEIDTYLESNPKLLEKLWMLEFKVSIHS